MDLQQGWAVTTLFDPQEGFDGLLQRLGSFAAPPWNKPNCDTFLCLLGAVDHYRVHSTQAGDSLVYES